MSDKIQKSELMSYYIDGSAKKVMAAARTNISPKIVINKKNFVFKEAIDQLNQERLSTRKIIPN